MDRKPVLRYAPSPTGPQHVGGLRTALYCHLLAKQLGGELILRIEDTDQGRFVPGAEEFIIKAVNWAGLEFTQGVHLGGPHAPYRQSERSAIYAAHAQQLLDAGQAYLAFDTESELEEMRQRLEAAGSEVRTYNYLTRMTMRNSLTMPAEEVAALLAAGTPHVVRFRIPEKVDVRFHDEIRGHIHVHASHLDDKVLLKSDGLPTYHLANVVDDRLMAVTHVVRGEEWLPSTPLHVLLYRAFGWEAEMPKFAHLALLLDPQGRKLSKRNAAEFGIPVFPFNWFDEASGEIWEGYADLGYLPEAIVSYIALLGWNPGTEEERLTMPELVQAFSLERCHHSGAKFDIKKLNSFQEHYLRAYPAEELAEMLKPHAEKAGYSTDALLLARVAAMMKERVTFAHQMVSDGGYLFHAPTAFDPGMVTKQWKGDAPALLADFSAVLAALDAWTTTTVHDAFQEFVTARGLGFGKVMAPLRLVLTGVPGGPAVFDIAEAIGRDETLQRIQHAIQHLGVPA
jgi:glutamyl-tRNA synthetase